MVSNALGIVLEELGRTSIIPISGLAPDNNNSCLIQLSDDLKLQIELDKKEQNLLVGCALGKPIKGSFRTDLFKEALRVNGLPLPRHGIFAFSVKTENLILFDLLDLNGLTGEKLGDYLLPFLDKARIWIKAIHENELPPVVSPPSKGLESIFGLLK